MHRRLIELGRHVALRDQRLFESIEIVLRHDTVLDRPDHEGEFRGQMAR